LISVSDKSRRNSSFEERFNITVVSYGSFVICHWEKQGIEKRKNKLKNILLIAFLSIILLNVIINSPALAGQTTTGSQIFKANCAVCH
jgi:hypothetical protein